MSDFYDLCKFHLLFNIVQLLYVDMDTFDNHDMLHGIYLDLSSLKLYSKNNGRTVSLTPDDV